MIASQERSAQSCCQRRSCKANEVALDARSAGRLCLPFWEWLRLRCNTSQHLNTCSRNSSRHAQRRVLHALAQRDCNAPRLDIAHHRDCDFEEAMYIPALDRGACGVPTAGLLCSAAVQLLLQPACLHVLRLMLFALSRPRMVLVAMMRCEWLQEQAHALAVAAEKPARRFNVDPCAPSSQLPFLPRYWFL